jgi:Uma2 family endonuclease
MKEITNINQLNLKSSKYTYADYLLWKFTERVELIKGKIFEMSPAPSRNHQEISWSIARELDHILHQKKCKMYTAPFDVRLVNFKESTDDNKIISVVQPDLCVVCDLEKLDDRGCIGSPDLIIEILSPGNSKKEMGVKFSLYEENKVREYWIVNPLEKNALIYVLENDKYIGLKPVTEDNILQSSIFPTLKFKLSKIFES